MLVALNPVSEALQTTGGTELIAGWLTSVAAVLPVWGALALILVSAMAVTPFLNNAATVLVMAPIAAMFASGLHLRPDAFLMAVAVGAGCDFLTPIGHQCNTLVMGPGGYRFGDYARLGAPLSLLVIILGVPLKSEEHTSELQSLMRISYAVFCLKNKTQISLKHNIDTHTRPLH